MRGVILKKLSLFIASLLAGTFGIAAFAGASTTTHHVVAAHVTKHSSTLSPQLQLGQTLFDENCSSCHGIDAQGSMLAPKLQGRGAATIDLWVSSGWMPLAVPTDQPRRGVDKFTRAQTTAIANYVASIKAGGFAIPSGSIAGANVSQGQELFSENCAGCHTITGAGDALSGDLNAPSLHGLTTTQITEAIETAPGNMPHFYPGALTATQVKDVVAYVANDLAHPNNSGGIGLGGNGPVAEGFVGLFLGVGACLLFALWVGDRSEDDEAHETEAVKEAHV
jgi:ubiquinol-cytochrome c reductase cytochrome c subunit